MGMGDGEAGLRLRAVGGWRWRCHEGYNRRVITVLGSSSAGASRKQTALGILVAVVGLGIVTRPRRYRVHRTHRVSTSTVSRRARSSAPGPMSSQQAPAPLVGRRRQLDSINSRSTALVGPCLASSTHRDATKPGSQTRREGQRRRQRQCRFVPIVGLQRPSGSLRRPPRTDPYPPSRSCCRYSIMRPGRDCTEALAHPDPTAAPSSHPPLDRPCASRSRALLTFISTRRLHRRPNTDNDRA